MFNRFCEIEEYILKQDFKATIALAGSHDDDALSAVVNARRKGIINDSFLQSFLYCLLQFNMLK